MRLFCLSAVLSCSLLAADARAQQPTVVHAQLSTESARGGLENELHTLAQGGAAMWVGYSVPVQKGYQSGWGRQQTAFLEDGDLRRDWTADGSKDATPREQQRAIVLFRLAGGGVDKVRLESPDRTLDAGGLRFVWLTDVSPESSVAELKHVAETGSKGQRESAVFAIAVHRSDAALPALVELAGANQPAEMREHAAFWLANQRGHEGFLAIQKLDREDADAGFRRKLAFDLTVSHDPGATAELIRMAHEDSSPEVRAQAQFWMATRGGESVAGSLVRSAQTDPDRHTRGQAVFAISRLPNGEAEPKLEELATSSKDAYVRQQAVFWLGQSKDPRALAFLTRILQTP